MINRQENAPQVSYFFRYFMSFYLEFLLNKNGPWCLYKMLTCILFDKNAGVLKLGCFIIMYVLDSI